VIARLGVLLAGFGIIGLAGASVLLNIFTLGMLIWQALPLLRQARANQPPSDAKPVSYRFMLIEAWPLMLNHLLATIFFKIDVTLLEPLKGPDVVAKYSVSYKWVDAIGVIPAFFTMALLPVMSRQAHEDKPGLLRNYQLAVKMLVMVALPIAVVTTFLAPTLIEILAGARYLPDGARALQLMIWFIPVGWINSLTQYVLIALDLQRPLKWPFVAGVIFNIGANLLFIPIFSYQAASVVTILSEVVLQIGFYVLLRPALGGVNWTKLLGRPVLAGVAMFGVLAVVWNIAPIIALVAAGLTYPIALVGFRALNPDEITRLAPLLPGPVRRLARV
jgi:O-antigen/teichoic acid export membrane protein